MGSGAGCFRRVGTGISQSRCSTSGRTANLSLAGFVTAEKFPHGARPLLRAFSRLLRCIGLSSRVELGAWSRKMADPPARVRAPGRAVSWGCPSVHPSTPQGRGCQRALAAVLLPDPGIALLL